MNFGLQNAQSGYGENALVHPDKLRQRDISNKDVACKESAMFTVRFFDILTGAHGVSHPVEYNRQAIGKTTSKGTRGWLKRH